MTDTNHQGKQIFEDVQINQKFMDKNGNQFIKTDNYAAKRIADNKNIYFDDNDKVIIL